MARTVEAIEAELLANPDNAEIKVMIDDAIITRSPQERRDIIRKWAEDLHVDEVADDAYAELKAQQIVVDSEKKTRRQQVLSAVVRLQRNVEVLESTSTTQKNWSVMTAGERQEASRLGLLEVHKDLLGIITILKDSGIFRPDDNGV